MTIVKTKQEAIEKLEEIRELKKNLDLELDVNCQMKINKNSYIKLRNYSQLKIIYLSIGFIQYFFSTMKNNKRNKILQTSK